jgi:hypothetical protein
MILVAKAIHEPKNGYPDYVEVELPKFRAILAREKCFAYAWTFNARGWAIAKVRQELKQKQHIWLYLVGEPWFSPLRVRIIDVRHKPQPLPCPREWVQYAPQYPKGSYLDGRFPNWKGTGKSKPIHLWFLIDKIEPIGPPENLRHFAPYFSKRRKPPRYCEYKQGCFAFLRAREDC